MCFIIDSIPFGATPMATVWLHMEQRRSISPHDAIAVSAINAARSTEKHNLRPSGKIESKI